MIHAQTLAFAACVPPEAIKDNTAATAVAVDTLGYDYCTVVVTMGATDIAAAAMKITECATSGGSYADVTGLIAGTSNAITGSTSTLPDTTDNAIHVFEFPCHDRLQFLKLAFTAGNGSSGSFQSAIAILSRDTDGQSIDTAAGRGAAQVIRLPE